MSVQRLVTPWTVALFLEAVALKDAKITLSKTLFYGDNAVQNTYIP